MTKQLPVKAKVGRPTKYRPEFCERVIEIGRQGGSHAQMMVALNVFGQAFYRYVEVFPEFSKAVKVAESLALAYWEELGMLGCKMGKDFNAVTYIFIMKNRFKQHYADTKQIDASDAFLKTWQAISDSRSDRPMKTIEHTT